MLKVILIITVILIYFCIYSLCCAAKSGDSEMERLNELIDKEKTKDL